MEKISDYLKLNIEIKESRDKIYGYCALCLIRKDKVLPFSKIINSLFRNFKHFDNWTKKIWNIYKKSDKRLKRLFKKYKMIYPNNRIKHGNYYEISKGFAYKPNQITINKNFSPLDLENRLKFSLRNLEIKKDYECKEIIGFDTETYMGKCKLLSRSDNKKSRKKKLYIKSNF